MDTAVSEATAGVDYDPYAPESMVDPRPAYAALRKAGPLHYLPQYNAWALARFEAVWQVARDGRNFTTEHHGMAPISSLLGEPGIPNFTQATPRRHTAIRRILNSGYDRAAAERDTEYMRTLARETIASLVAQGDGTMDVFADYANRVAARYAGYKVGLPDEDAERIRHRAEQFFHREPGQRGTSEANAAAGAEVFTYLQELVDSARKDPDGAHGDLARLVEGRAQGEPLSDEEILGDLYTLIITGSETTEISVAATLYNLAQHPDQLDAVRADPSLLQPAFIETIRYDHPTDILCREVLNEVEVCGRTLLPGQQVIMMWGSAGRDEDEYPDADRYDIHREPARSLLFGHGQYKCLGESVALRLGTVLLEEFFAAVDSYTVDRDRCTRKYAEFVQGFNGVPVSYTVRTAGRGGDA
ncbi:cytochrome P450 [Tomitella gaofuii]|uniref:cytochrome P450 n=1 Tax=Tomitella gaofuii TaxID=2760083 RepID=UPI0015F819EB|nr:cytochrome P450 [Tomitella gaofuii]